MREHCATGFDCVDKQCVALPGTVCQERVRVQPCELSAGVCARVRRGCVDGAFEQTCTAASYGPTYEALETRCDGLDNDCDGRVDTGALPVGLPGKLLVFPRGYALVTWSSDYDWNTQVSYQLLTPQLEPAGPRLRLEAAAFPALLSQTVRAIPLGDGAIVLWSGAESSSGSQRSRIVRIAHGEKWGDVSLAAGPETLEGLSGATPHLALDGTRQRLLVAWLEAGQVQGQLLSPELASLARAPLLEEAELGATAPGVSTGSWLSLGGVTAVGTAEFGVAALSTEASGARRVLFRTVSGALASRSALTAYEGAPGMTELGVTSTAAGSPVMSWLTTFSAPDGDHLAVDLVRPLSPTLPLRVFEGRAMGTPRLVTAFGTAGDLALALTGSLVDGRPRLILHLVSPDNQVRGQPLDLAASSAPELTWMPDLSKWWVSSGDWTGETGWACGPVAPPHAPT
ncbi:MULTISPECIES: putative metal-binding motif-containing protein [Myxococcaceae]|uniref:putative metal-binding motif-containing protein n=1 Tax=Myxococcaceae TaxID=31 RepID=UPI00188E8B95